MTKKIDPLVLYALGAIPGAFINGAFVYSLQKKDDYLKHHAAVSGIKIDFEGLERGGYDKGD